MKKLIAAALIAAALVGISASAAEARTAHHHVARDTQWGG